MNKKLKKRIFKVSGTSFCALVYAFLFLPIVVIVTNSFNATTTKPYQTWKGFTFDWYVRLFDGSNASLLDSFKNTIIIAVTSTLLATVIGTLAAVGMYRYTFRGKSVIDGMLYIPVVIPEIVIGIALLTIFALVNVPRGMLTLILSHVSFSIPFVIFNVRARLAGYDNSIEEASMDLGAGRIGTLLRITLPVLTPGILGGALLAFTLSIDDVIISKFVAGNTYTFPLKVWDSIKSGVSPAVNALSTLILIGTIVFVVLTQSNLLKSEKRKSFKKKRKAR
ncbi:MAG: ABC transporter permease subunit [Oscillospiraceae bacterium]|jgi:spermidine/putrescine transport system permease protein|nr:ABC transporter permease subunit [Oscillospiraceae bacterium]